MKNIWSIFKNVLRYCMAVLVGAGILFTGTFYVFTGDALSFVKIFKTFYIVEHFSAVPVDKATLLDGALAGIVQKLDDRHSLYVGGNQYDELKEETDGSYGGIGVYLSVREDKPVVIGVVAGEPADLSGVKRGDVIMAIDGEGVNGVAIDVISRKIRGSVGSSVQLTLDESGNEKNVTIERKQIPLTTVVGKMMDNQIGYIRIGMFSGHTGQEFADAYQKLQGEGMKKMIVDLRYNPGGLVAQAVAVADVFIPANTIVSIVDRDGNMEEYQTTHSPETMPTVVLVNENSASAAEILAGAVQDLKLGTIVGIKSYGKGTVQNIFSLNQQEAIKLTVAKYATPSGKFIDGVGIIPDVEVKNSDTDTEDYQLKKALELLNQ